MSSLDALRSFSGTVVFVSHDRHFIDGLATRIVEVENGKLTSYYGDYEYYVEKKGALETLTINGDKSIVSNTHAVETSPVSVSPSPVPVSKDERQRQREEEKQRQREERQRQKLLAELEQEIEQYENKLSELEKQMADSSYFADHETARQGGDEHALLSARIVALYEEWEKWHS